MAGNRPGQQWVQQEGEHRATYNWNDTVTNHNVKSLQVVAGLKAERELLPVSQPTIVYNTLFHTSTTSHSSHTVAPNSNFELCGGRVRSVAETTESTAGPAAEPMV